MLKIIALKFLCYNNSLHVAWRLKRRRWVVVMVVMVVVVVVGMVEVVGGSHSEWQVGK